MTDLSDDRDTKQKIREITDRGGALSYLKNRRKYLVLLAALVVVLGGAAMVYDSVEFNFEPGEQNQTEEVELTKYQKNYVDCPDRYLEFCTEMSKIPTEPVEFIKTENGRIHLRMQNGNRMVARLPTKNREGYLIRIEE